MVSGNVSLHPNSSPKRSQCRAGPNLRRSWRESGHEAKEAGDGQSLGADTGLTPEEHRFVKTKLMGSNAFLADIAYRYQFLDDSKQMESSKMELSKMGRDGEAAESEEDRMHKALQPLPGPHGSIDSVCRIW